MPISWKTSDGRTGVAENDYEFSMQHSDMSDFRYTDQQRLEESFNALKGTPGQAPALGTPGQAPPLGEPGQSPPLGTPGQAPPLGEPGQAPPLKEPSESTPYTKFADYVHDLRVKFMGEPEKWSTKEHMGMFLDQAMSVMGAGYRVPKGPISGLKTINWPEGWGTKHPEGLKFATAEYPHVQKAFKEAMESGAKTIPEIIDHMILSGTPSTPGIVQSLRKKAGLTQEPSERWSTEKHDKFMELVKSGKTDREISEIMGITRNSVIGKITRLQEADPNFERTVSSTSKSTVSAKVEKIKELAEKGMVANEIGKELGHTGAYIRILSSAAGIELPRDPRSLGGGGRKNPNISESKWYQYLQKRLSLSKEEGLTTETIPQKQQAQDNRYNPSNLDMRLKIDKVLKDNPSLRQVPFRFDSSQIQKLTHQEYLDMLSSEDSTKYLISKGIKPNR